MRKVPTPFNRGDVIRPAVQDDRGAVTLFDYRGGAWVPLSCGRFRVRACWRPFHYANGLVWLDESPGVFCTRHFHLVERGAAEVAEAAPRATTVVTLVRPADSPARRDQINPDHYKKKPVECIDAMRWAYGDAVVRAFCMGNAFKYRWRAGDKPESAHTTDMAKARWYDDFARFLDGAGPDPRHKKET